jgi:hypothetical protein
VSAGRKRHRWAKGHSYAVCKDCGMRYRLGMVNRLYEHPDFQRGAHVLAGSCPPDTAERRAALIRCAVNPVDT